MGEVLQHGISMSCEYLFRPVKQYHGHESFTGMGEHMSELLTYIILLIKIVLLQENTSF